MLLVSSTEDFWCGIVFRINVSISNNVLKLCLYCVNRESLCASFACSRESSSCNENCVLPSKKWNFSTEFRILEKPILVWNAICMLFVGWKVRVVKNCYPGLENAARGSRAAFPGRPNSANNMFTVFFLK